MLHRSSSPPPIHPHRPCLPESRAALATLPPPPPPPCPPPPFYALSPPTPPPPEAPPTETPETEANVAKKAPQSCRTSTGTEVKDNSVVGNPFEGVDPFTNSIGIQRYQTSTRSSSRRWRTNWGSVGGRDQVELERPALAQGRAAPALHQQGGGLLWHRHGPRLRVTGTTGDFAGTGGATPPGTGAAPTTGSAGTTGTGTGLTPTTATTTATATATATAPTVAHSRGSLQPVQQQRPRPPLQPLILPSAQPVPPPAPPLQQPSARPARPPLRLLLPPPPEQQRPVDPQQAAPMPRQALVSSLLPPRRRRRVPRLQLQTRLGHRHSPPRCHQSLRRCHRHPRPRRPLLNSRKNHHTR